MVRYGGYRLGRGNLGALLRYSPGGSLSGATFSRASSATYIDANGVLQTAASGAARDAHYIGGVRHLLLEGQRTNDCLHNRDLTNAAWVKTGCTAAKDRSGVDGVANSASSLTAITPNATCLQSITLASSARFQSVYIQRITGSGVVEMTMDNGATWTPVTVTASWARVSIPTQTLANPTVGFRIVTSGDAVAIDYAQNENSTFASSAIATTTAAVTRSADSLYFPYTTPPSNNTTFIEGVELGTKATGADGGRVFEYGSGGNTRLMIWNNGASGSAYGGLYDTGPATSVSSAAAVPAHGDALTLRLVQAANGSVQLGQSINGGAEAVAAAGGAAALSPSFSAQRLYLNSNGSGAGVGFFAFSKVVVLKGTRTLEQCRAA